MSGDSTGLKLRSSSIHRNANEQFDNSTAWINESIDETPSKVNDKKADNSSQMSTTVEISVHQETPTSPPAHGFSSTTIITTSCSVDTLNGETTGLSLLSGPSSPSNLSSVTLVGSTGSGSAPNEKDENGQNHRKFQFSQAPTSPLPERKRKTSAPENGKNDVVPSEAKEDSSPAVKTLENDDAVRTVKPNDNVCSKPKIVSALAKNHLKDDGSRPSSTHSTPIKVSSNVLQPMSYLTMNRRPSAGTIGVPVAALNQHRRSLQLNSSEGGFGLNKVWNIECSILLSCALIVFFFFSVFD